LAKSVVATGKVTPITKVEVKSKASGIVKKLLVEYGDTVKQGQLLAQLDKVEIEAQVEQSRAALQAAEANLASSQADHERSKVDAEGPDVPLLKRQYDRSVEMAKDGVVSASALDDATIQCVLAWVTSTANATQTTLTVASTAGFLPYGYVQVENEICFYGAVTSTTQLSPVIRAQCGTTAATHSANVSVAHLSAWFKGNRNPNEIAVSTDTVELPNAFIWLVQDFVLARCNTAQSDMQGWAAYMKYFNDECKRIQQDPSWRSDAQGNQVIPYGVPLAGRLAWSPWGVLVP
jgi:hypothetical protein